MQKMSNGDYFDEKMRRGDRSKEARRISPPLKLLLKSPKLRGSTAPKSAHLHRGREQGGVTLEGIKENLCKLLFALNFTFAFISFFFFLAIPKTCISMLWFRNHILVWGSMRNGFT